jgi:class 3 adenylate cyclase
MRGFLFADLRGYTGYVEAHGDHAGAKLLDRYQALVREAVAGAAGAEIRTDGDSFYVVFDSASAAVGCGLSILAAAAASDPADPIRVGVGVHAGETVETADGFVGSAVNIAARLCAEAKAGELVVSETIRGLTLTYLDVAFEPLGARHLKGIAEPVACYRVVARGEVPVHLRAGPSAGGRRPSRLLAAGLGAAALVAAAVGAAALGGGHAATPTPGPSTAGFDESPAGTSASPGGSASGPSAAAIASASLPPSATPTAPTASPTLGPFPNEVEAAILAALPSALAKTCVRGGTPDDARLAGFVGETKSPPGNPVWPITPASSGGVTRHPVSGAMRTYVMAPKRPYGDIAPADEYLSYFEGNYNLPYGSCATATRAHESWTGPRGSGQLACMNPYEGRPWIYFTLGGGKYLGFATRDDADHDAVYAWWDQLKTFLP